MKKIFIVAGDPSGDIHASKLMIALKDKSKDLEFVGIGGKEMTKVGLNSIASIEKMSVVGFWEVAKKYKFFKRILNKCINLMQNDKIDAFIPVDYPGFNIRLSKKAKDFQIPVIYYIAPQLWAWGKKRASKLAKNTDLLLTVFPFEQEFFNKYNINTKFIGHPLLDNPILQNNFPNFNERENLIALLPGSREQEIKQHLPIMEKIVKSNAANLPNYKIGIATSNNNSINVINDYLSKNKDWLLFENSLELMSKAKVGIVKAGTSNLEAALCGMPFIMLYKTSFITYFLGKRLINLDFISLVNIILQKKVVTEYIQSNINIDKMSNELRELISNRIKYEQLQNSFSDIKEILGNKGASINAADIIFNFLGNK